MLSAPARHADGGARCNEMSWCGGATTEVVVVPAHGHCLPWLQYVEAPPDRAAQAVAAHTHATHLPGTGS